AVVRGRLGPAGRLVRGFDGVADVLAVAFADVGQEAAVGAHDRAAVGAVRARLLAADVKLGGTVDGEGVTLFRLLHFAFFSNDRCGRAAVFRQRGQVLVHALFAAFAAEAR